MTDRLILEPVGAAYHLMATDGTPESWTFLGEIRRTPEGTGWMMQPSARLPLDAMTFDFIGSDFGFPERVLDTGPNPG